MYRNEKITIIVVAYNRIKPLKRLLTSLNEANYFDDKVTLYISIDNGDNEPVLELANNFDWLHGKKIINYNKSNLGLKKHIIKCGDLSNEFDNIIILEDDTFVSNDFYNYAKSTLEFYKEDKSIAGISLYSQRINEISNLPFLPIHDSNDVFFFKLPASSGQLWTKNQWNNFKSWYNNYNEDISCSNKLPNNIKKWPESSWKKYFALYMQEEDKYFVYPQHSLSTNFGEEGTHALQNSNRHQTPLLFSFDYTNFNLAFLEESKAVYDIYYENEALYDYLHKKFDICPEEITIDLYGQKSNDLFKRYVLTSRKCNYLSLASFANRLYPHELNILKNIKGKAFHLYDTQNSIDHKNRSFNLINFNDRYNRLKYFYSKLSFKDIVVMLLGKIKGKL